jgi:ankyrin repeat protein
MVEFLLGKGVDPNPRNNDGQSPLSAAAAQDRPACVALLLERIDIENEIAAGSPAAYTVLTSAAAFGHESVVKQLLEKGVDPDSRGACSQPPPSIVMCTGIHWLQKNNMLTSGRIRFRCTFSR